MILSDQIRVWADRDSAPTYRLLYDWMDHAVHLETEIARLGLENARLRAELCPPTVADSPLQRAFECTSAQNTSDIAPHMPYERSLLSYEHEQQERNLAWGRRG